MDPFLIGAASVALLLVLLASGLPVAFALVLASASGLCAILGVDAALTLTASTFFVVGTNATLIVVPLFIAMGFLATEIGAAPRVYDALACWTERVRGSLGLATIGACTLFGALTGSSIATATLFASVSAPQMIRHGWDPKLAYGLVAAAGAIGMLIPPSILGILYAAMAELPIGAVLLAGIGPGLLLATCLAGAVVAIAVLQPERAPRPPRRSSARERLATLPAFASPIAVVAFVLGGLYAGLLTTTEAAAVANVVLLAGFVLRRRTDRLVVVAIGTATLTSALFAIFAAAQLFSRLIVVSGLAETFVTALVAAAPSAGVLAVGTALLILALGCVLDSLSILVVTVPLILPAAKTLGVDPLWLGAVMILAAQIGLITPPIGLNLYVVKAAAGESATTSDVVTGALPFLAASLVALAILLAVPEVASAIPRLLSSR